MVYYVTSYEVHDDAPTYFTKFFGTREGLEGYLPTIKDKDVRVGELTEEQMEEYYSPIFV